MIELRPYQSDLINGVRQAFAEHNSVVMVLPTGGGKTLTTATMLKGAAAKGKRCIFCVHRVELLYQTSLSFKRLDIAHGFIAAAEDYDPAIITHIASIDTLRRRLDDVQRPDFLVIDEAHRAMADSWRKVATHWPDAKVLLITATPERLDGKGLKHIAQTMVEGVSTSWLIENGYLAPYRAYGTNVKPDMQGVKTTGGDYNLGQLAAAMDKSILTGDAIEHYKKHAADKQGIVFAVTIEHSKNIVAQFNEAGIPAAHLDGDTSKRAREDTVERFRYGEIRILSNVNLFTEGFDVPSAEVCIMLRPTKSLSLYLQMAGRVLRPQPGKTAIILDHAGNIHRHGMLDIDRAWSLEGRSGNKITKPPPIWECERCYHVWPARPGKTKTCPACFHTHGVEKREIEVQGGDLAEITKQSNPWAWAATRPLNRVLQKASTYRDLLDIAKARGYKPGWAYHRAHDMGIKLGE